MPEIKNTFLKSKMNKDLDARLVPNGEYRDAQNISVSRSEGSDAGALENLLGNTLLTKLKISLPALESSKVDNRYYATTGDFALDSLEIIGKYIDESNDRIFLFITDYKDSSNDQLSNFAPGDVTVVLTNPSTPPNEQFEAKGSACYIVEHNLINNVSTVLVGGNFLNFSKTHPIININLLEDLLFWTDNRNQPRKINVKKASINSPSGNGSWQSWVPSLLPISNALANQPYYYHEDTISVAKFAPYTSMNFVSLSNGVYQSNLISKGSEYLSSHIMTTVVSPGYDSSTGVLTIQGSYNSTSSTNPELKIGDKVIIHKVNGEEEEACTAVTNNTLTIASGLLDVQVGDVVEIQRQNPDYDSTYKGDTNLLKDKFSKFSYRFKYDDDEYSLMAPFTQAAFIPKQFGYFKYNDENSAAESGNVKFMENMVDNVKLNINLPYAGNKLQRNLKIKEIQILVKNSDELAVRVIEDIPVAKISSAISGGTVYTYDYLSTKPIKTLPEADLTRVHDRIPIRALTQESVANRIVYGNFLDKHSSPDNIKYQLAYAEKSYPSGSSSTDEENKEFTVEFPTHTVKKNRSYQVGIVLVDRYGRASNVILNSSDSVTTGNKNSTIYAPYSKPANSVNYWGNYLIFALTQDIPSSLNKEGYPGLYSENNPLGYYSYRIVVKQQEQDYYNVYTPGALAGKITWDVTSSEQRPVFSSENNTSLITLFGDNINKVPRELKTSNANDETYGSEVIFYNIVNPIYDDNDSDTLYYYNKQSDVNIVGEKVISIQPFKSIGDWATTKGVLYPNGDTSTSPPEPWYPYYTTGSSSNFLFNFHDIFFNAQSNPFIASIDTNFKIGATPVYNQANPNQKSGIERAFVDYNTGFLNLGVFETKPTTSNLDIYWESSTSGLITDLNAEPGLDIPAGLKDTAGNNTATGSSLQYTHFENDASGTDLTLNFDLVNSIGNALSTTPSLTIDSVLDGDNNNRSSEFAINNISAGTFRIKSNSTFVFNENANVLENYTFNFLATDTAGTPTYTNVPIQISNCRLQNIAPTWLVNIPATNYILNSPYTSTIYTIYFGSVTNGSADTTRRTEQLVYEVIDDPNYAFQPGSGALDFKIVSSTPNFNLVANTDSSTLAVGSTYSLIIKVTDANGDGLSTNSNVFTVQVVPQ
jgi:hypothetical protein